MNMLQPDLRAVLAQAGRLRHALRAPVRCGVLVVLGCLVSALSSEAQSSSRFTLARGVMAGGGATVSGSSHFELGGTVGQPLAAVPGSARFSIQGGFWIWPAPIIFAPMKVGANFLLSFQTEPGKTYTVVCSDSLSSASWQPLTTVAGDGTVKTATNSVAGVAKRFYRLVEQYGVSIRSGPIIFSPVKAGSNFMFYFGTEPGKTYTVQYADSLPTLNWQRLPGITGDGTVKTVTDAVSGARQRFYRLVVQ